MGQVAMCVDLRSGKVLSRAFHGTTMCNLKNEVSPKVEHTWITGKHCTKKKKKIIRIQRRGQNIFYLKNTSAVQLSPSSSSEFFIFLNRNSSTLATSCEELAHWKRPWCWEGLVAGGEGDARGWDGWMASLTEWTWVWVKSGSLWWTGRPGMLQFMGSRRVGHDWATELNWTDLWREWSNTQE